VASGYTANKEHHGGWNRPDY